MRELGERALPASNIGEEQDDRERATCPIYEAVIRFQVDQYESPESVVQNMFYGADTGDWTGHSCQLRSLQRVVEE